MKRKGLSYSSYSLDRTEVFSSLFHDTVAFFHYSFVSFAPVTYLKLFITTRTSTGARKKKTSEKGKRNAQQNLKENDLLFSIGVWHVATQTFWLDDFHYFSFFSL